MIELKPVRVTQKQRKGRETAELKPVRVMKKQRKGRETAELKPGAGDAKTAQRAQKGRRKFREKE